MTLKEMVRKYPNAAQALYDQGFDAGQRAEREQWEGRVLSEQQTNLFLDSMLEEALLDAK